MIHVLLTRTPLYSQDCSCFLVRLACVKRAASVDSEPGSNSRLNLMANRTLAGPIDRIVSRSGFKLRLLTNFFVYTHRRLHAHAFYIASNQIFKDLRRWNPRSLRKAIRCRPRKPYECRSGAKRHDSDRIQKLGNLKELFRWRLSGLQMIPGNQNRVLLPTFTLHSGTVVPLRTSSTLANPGPTRKRKVKILTFLSLVVSRSLLRAWERLA